VDVVLASARSDLRFALEVFLREQPGVVVVGTATGARGLLALIRTTCPDLVILDWGLPGQPLAKVLDEARAHEQPPSTIVLGRDEFDRQPALDAGADVYVQRGDPPETLLVALRQLRSRRGAPVDPIPTKAKGE
jgi:DNA-binding NarL/FixJ family response regulator